MCRGRWLEYLAEVGHRRPVVREALHRSPKTAYEHAWEIRNGYGFRVFEDAQVAAEFRRFLDGRVWTQAEGPAALFEQGVGWLRRNRVLLPGISVLTRLVNTVREAAAERMYTVLAAAAGEADPLLPGRLRASLWVPEGSRLSMLEQWRRSPTRVSGPGLVKALDRAADLAGLGVRAVDCSAVPANRMAMLARYGLASKAPTLEELAEPRRTATLLAVTRHLDAAAIDDALDLFVLLMATRPINPAQRASDKERMGWLPRLERASRMLARVNRELLRALDAAAFAEEKLDVDTAWAAIEQIAPRAEVDGAVAVVEELVPDDVAADAAMRVSLAERYATVRPFLPLLGESSSLFATAGGAKVLAAVQTLPALAAPAFRRGRSGRLRDVRARTAAQGAACAGRVRGPVAALGRPPRPAARRGPRGRPCATRSWTGWASLNRCRPICGPRSRCSTRRGGRWPTGSPRPETPPACASSRRHAQPQRGAETRRPPTSGAQLQGQPRTRRLTRDTSTPRPRSVGRPLPAVRRDQVEKEAAPPKEEVWGQPARLTPAGCRGHERCCTDSLIYTKCIGYS